MILSVLMVILNMQIYSLPNSPLVHPAIDEDGESSLLIDSVRESITISIIQQFTIQQQTVIQFKFSFLLILRSIDQNNIQGNKLFPCH